MVVLRCQDISLFVEELKPQRSADFLQHSNFCKVVAFAVLQDDFCSEALYCRLSLLVIANDMMDGLKKMFSCSNFFMLASIDAMLSFMDYAQQTGKNKSY